MTNTLVNNSKATSNTMHSVSHGEGGANRQAAISKVQGRVPVKSNTDFSKSTIAELFGCNVFNRATMRQLLPKAVYKAVCAH